MRRLVLSGILLALLGTAVWAIPNAWAAPLSKRYEFKGGVTLEMAADTTSGLRLDTVRFQVPAARGDRLMPTGGPLTAAVAVSNTAGKSHMVGLAIALYDDDGHLLAVASGGNRIAPIRPDRQKTFNLVFEGRQRSSHPGLQLPNRSATRVGQVVGVRRPVRRGTRPNSHQRGTGRWSAPSKRRPPLER